MDAQKENPLYKAKLVENKRIAPNTYELTFKTTNKFSFEAGQYVWLQLINMVEIDPSGDRRAMSMVNPPNNDNEVVFILHSSDSIYKKTLLQLKEDDEVLLNGPFGLAFKLPEDKTTPLILIAGGVGVAPFMSDIRYVISQNLETPIYLFSFNSSKEAYIYKDEILELNKNNSKCHGNVFNRHFAWDDIRNIPPLKKALIYVAGTQAFVNHATAILNKNGIKDSQIKYENYYPINSKTKFLHDYFNDQGKLILDKAKDKPDIMHLAVESTSHHIIITDVNGIIVFANDAATKITGYSFNEMRGNTPRLWGGLMSKQFYDILWNTAMAGNDVNSELVNHRKNGDLYWVMAHITPIKDNDGSVIGFIGTEEDVTNLKDKEHVLEIKNSINSELINNKVGIESLQRILEIIAMGFNWDFASIWLADKKDDNLRSVYVWKRDPSKYNDFENITETITFASGFGLPGRVLKDRQSSWVNNVLEDDNFPRAPYAKLSQLNTGFAFPIYDEDRVFAVIEFFSERIKELHDSNDYIIPMFNSIGIEIGRFWHQKEQEDLIFHDEKQLELATKSASIGVWEWDLLTNNLTWDQQMRNLYDIASDVPITYELWRDSIHPDDKEKTEDALKNAVNGKAEYDISFRIILPSGETRFIKARAVIEKDSVGMPLRMIGVNTDVTLETEVDKEKTEFVSLVSHQLKTPMSSISWNTEMLLNGDYGKLAPKQKNILESMYQTNHRMNELVNSLLNVSRIELGVFIVEPEPVDIIKACEEVITEMQPRLLEKQHQLIKDFQKDLPEIPADPKLLRIVFQNYISNAIKYTPDKGHVIITINQQNDDLLISVANNGEPIPPEEQKNIFGKLFRASNARHQVADGNGLGLYLVKAIAENSGGRAWFESGEGKDTIFYLSFPITGMLKSSSNSN